MLARLFRLWHHGGMDSYWRWLEYGVPELKAVQAMEHNERVTLSGEPATTNDGAPQPLDPRTGMYKDYWILSDEERAKGFVRPVRLAYKHVGSPAPQHPLRDLTPEEHERYDRVGYVKYEEYRGAGTSVTGRYWTQAQLDNAGKGCGTVTTMNTKIAETYARNPYFYGATYCAGCRVHLPVGRDGEFVWDGTTQRVGE